MIASDGWGISVPHPDDAEKHLDKFMNDHPDLYDHFLDTIEREGMRLGPHHYTGAQIEFLVMSGLARPVFHKVNDIEYVEMLQWNPLRSEYQTFGTLSPYEDDWHYAIMLYHLGWN